jgi:renalase
MTSVAVLGAGVTGLACARTLTETDGINVIMFNNGRTPGGRMACKDTSNGKIDYGAPCLSVSDPEFKKVVDNW